MKKILPALVVLILAASILAQTKQENLLENVEVRFALKGEPNAQEVGFDSPKSYWKVKYEIYITDFSEPEKLGLSRANDGYKYLTPIIENKTLTNRIKKKSTKILKGGFTKKMLLTEANREAVIRVKLPQNIIEVFNQAKINPEKNPTLVLFTTQKVYVKNSPENKLKEKQFLIDFLPLRLTRDDKQIKYRDLKTMTLITRIIKQENGELEYKGGLFHGVGW